MMTEQEQEDLRLELAIEAMKALIPSFGEEVEARRNVIAHKAFLMADAMLRAYEQRT